MENQLRDVAGGASGQYELERVKAEGENRVKAVEIVMHQLEQQLNEERAKNGPAGPVPGMPMTLDSLQSQQQVPRLHPQLTYEWSELTRLNVAAQMAGMVHKLQTNEIEVQKLAHELAHEKLQNQSKVDHMQGEHLEHVRELQQEIAHVCNVLAAMEEKCRILELTQEDMGAMQGALDEIEQVPAKLTFLSFKLTFLSFTPCNPRFPRTICVSQQACTVIYVRHGDLCLTRRFPSGS